MSMNRTRAVSLVIVFLLGCISTEAFVTRPALWQRHYTSPRMDRSSSYLISSRKRSSSSTTLNDQNNNENKDESDNDLMRTNGSIHTGSDSTMSVMDYTTMKPQVYSQRWVQLGYLSILALLSDWICFSVAATPQTFENCFPGHSAASLIDIFLFTNVASCFLVTDVVAKIGLQRAIQFAATVMTIGCWFRSGWGFMGTGGILDHLSLMAASSTTTVATTTTTTTTLVPYAWVVAGTILVGAAQPFFQCTPPLLSAQWFGSDERATSTAVALNFNQIGIATAFLVGGSMATSKDGLSQYFGLVAVLCTLATIGTWIFFQAKPPSPPSTSELEKLIRGEHEPPFWESAQTFFRTPGFTKPLAAFVCSITITNVVGAFIDDVMKRGGITEQFQIDLAGAGFEIAILLGGIVIGGYVDKTKEYKQVTLACLASSAVLLLPLGLTEHAIGKEPILLLLALLGLGMAAGPVQPINAELAVDVTYPGDETAVESIQQIGGNLISALLVPIAEQAARADYQLLPQYPRLASDVRGDVVLLTVLAGLTCAFFATFDAPLRRSLADDTSETREEDVMDVLCSSVEEEKLSGVDSVVASSEATKTTTTTTLTM